MKQAIIILSGLVIGCSSMVEISGTVISRDVSAMEYDGAGQITVQSESGVVYQVHVASCENPSLCNPAAVKAISNPSITGKTVVVKSKSITTNNVLQVGKHGAIDVQAL